MTDYDLQTDYGFLGLESFTCDDEAAKTKSKEPRTTRTKTCQNVTHIAQPADRAINKRLLPEKTTKPAFPNQQRMKTQPDNPLTEQITSDWKNRLLQIQNSQQSAKQQFKCQINNLNKKVQDAELRNITLEVDLRVMKNQMTEAYNLIKQLNEKLHRAQNFEQHQKYLNTITVRERQNVQSREENSMQKYIRPYGHQRLKSAGFEKLSLKRPAY